MRRKIRLKHKSSFFSLKKRDFIVIIFVLVGLGTFWLLEYASKRLAPGIMEYAKTEVRKISNIFINMAVSTEVRNQMDLDSLFVVDKDSEGNIRMIDFNPIVVNQILDDVVNNVNLNLKALSTGNLDQLVLDDPSLVDYNKDNLKKGIIAEVPSGVVFNNVILANLGPKIPIRIKIVGDIDVNIDTKVSNYGINNALIEVSIHFDINSQAILPFSSEEVNLETVVPIAIKIIQGTVPPYYIGGLDQSSSILTLPSE